MKHTKGKLLKSLICDVTPNATHIKIEKHPIGGHTINNIFRANHPTLQHGGFACVVVVPPTT